MEFQDTLQNEVANSADSSTLVKEISFVELQKRGIGLELKGYEDEIEARRWLVKATFWVSVLWLIAVLLIFLHYGRGVLKFSDGVVITFLTTTTANTLAFLTIIFRYLFDGARTAPKITLPSA